MSYTMTTSLPSGFAFSSWEEMDQNPHIASRQRLAVYVHPDGRVAKREYHGCTPTGVWTVYEAEEEVEETKGGLFDGYKNMLSSALRSYEKSMFPAILAARAGEMCAAVYANEGHPEPCGCAATVRVKYRRTGDWIPQCDSHAPEMLDPSSVPVETEDGRTHYRPSL